MWVHRNVAGHHNRCHIGVCAVATLSLGCLEFPITLDISPGLPDDNPNAPVLLAEKMFFQDPRSGTYFQFSPLRSRSCLGGGPPHCSKDVNFFRRRAVGMQALRSFQSPSLALLALLFGPPDRCPIRCEQQARPGIVDFHAVATRFVYP